MKHLLLLTLLLAFGSQAEIRKCTGADGKVTFSDSACAVNTVSEQGVKVYANTNSQDMSADRRAAAASGKRDRIDSMLASPPEECKFRSSASQDSKTLAANAARECVENIVSGNSSGQHRARWKEYWDSRNSSGGGNTTMRCRPDFVGGFRCF